MLMIFLEETWVAYSDLQNNAGVTHNNLKKVYILSLSTEIIFVGQVQLQHWEISWNFMIQQFSASIPVLKPRLYKQTNYKTLERSLELWYKTASN